MNTYAGNGTVGFKDGAAVNASFNAPGGLVVDSIGNVFVADSGNNRIRKINSTGFVSTFAGTLPGFKDGAGPTFNNPTDIKIDENNNLYLVDMGNNRIRKVDVSGVGSTIASGSPFRGLALDSTGDIYTSTPGQVTMINAIGLVSILAGNGSLVAAPDGSTSVVTFSSLLGVAIDPSGAVLVLDNVRSNLKKIVPPSS